MVPGYGRLHSSNNATTFRPRDASEGTGVVVRAGGLSPEPILLRCPCSAADPHLDLVLGPTDDRPDVIVVGFLGLVDPSVWTRQLAVHYHPDSEVWETLHPELVDSPPRSEQGHKRPDNSIVETKPCPTVSDTPLNKIVPDSSCC